MLICRHAFTVPLLIIIFAVGCNPSASTTRDVLAVFGRTGFGDGDFSYPRAIAVSPDGSVYAVDKTARVQKFDSNGVFLLGWKMPDRAAGKPIGLSVHRDGRVFVADTHYHRVVIFDPMGNQLATFGELGTGDGQFQLPTDVAFDQQGNVYVSEYGGNDRITKWSPDFHFLSAMGEKPIDGVRLNRPAGIDIDVEQSLWVADACNHRIVHMTLDGETLATYGEMGRESGKFRYPYDVDVSSSRMVMVAEFGGDRLQWLDKKGRFLQTWGSSGRKPGELSAPWGAAYGPNKNVYVVDSLNNRVQIIKP